MVKDSKYVSPSTMHWCPVCNKYTFQKAQTHTTRHKSRNLYWGDLVDPDTKYYAKYRERECPSCFDYLGVTKVRGFVEIAERQFLSLRRRVKKYYDESVSKDDEIKRLKDEVKFLQGRIEKAQIALNV